MPARLLRLLKCCSDPCEIERGKDLGGFGTGGVGIIGEEVAEWLERDGPPG